MIRVRLAGGLLAAGMATTSMVCAACAPATQRATGGAPAAVMVTQPPSETLSPLVQQALPGVKGKTFTSAIVSFPPAARAAPHRHGTAFVYAYVLEGTVRSELAGRPARTYRAGENWVEQPGAHHLLTENTSRTAPAKLLVVFVSDTGDKLKVDDPPG
ncbi:cupin domain-containing protein [Actinomadura sp. ATCC 31491]|uniref:Cupin domain-containing protein n=1 Tax=Actinomadura luzonensis TaxID=2805427 RepID=A0ABT0G1K6_9ACTN|nr:cupin domain-containing protein [Actinomadura luzonensis]MCK2218495.1 cupin domain-containing protein [Actinomadura luzonensis]